MFKLFFLATMMVLAAAKPGVVGPVYTAPYSAAYTAPVSAAYSDPFGYSAYSAPLAYTSPYYLG